MSTFIARSIIRKADISTEKGIEQYKGYFVKTRIYEPWRADVDTILRTEGYEAVIVAD